MIISVILVSVALMVAIAKVSTQLILSGMEKDVAQAIYAALSQICAPTVHHGSSNIYHQLLLIM